MAKILVKFELCQECLVCEAKCSYPYHPENPGFEALREQIARQLICRKCEEHFCVKACPREALEVLESGKLKRNLFKCIGCYSCALACPFGTLYQSYLVYKSQACDQCLEREPECVKTCPKQALELVEELPEPAESVSERVGVVGEFWQEKEPAK